MYITPLKSYPEPMYPTREQAWELPELLRAMPRRWQGQAMVLAAALTCSVLAGCRAKAAPSPPGVAGGVMPPPLPMTTTRVAPVFGTDPAARGGIRGKVAMPAFLSEEDALFIIMDEAKKAGIALAPTSQALPGLPNPLPAATGKPAAPVTLAFDGSDAARNLAIEFLSQEDRDAWQQAGGGTATLRDAAKALREEISKAGAGGTYGVFYDATYPGEDAKAHLRGQVREFIAWLKAEGVI
jgi:hypothetical protein